MATRKKNHYVNNKELFAAMVQYKQACADAKENGTEKPRIPKYAGECILHIANRLATKPNFVNYQFREDMIMDGVENCITYFDNFNPEKSNNPFAYFTQIIKFAFIRKIQKEKKHLYVKHKTLHNSAIFGLLEYSDDGESMSTIDLDNEYMSNLVKDFESKIEAKKRKKKEAKEGIEKFVDSDTENVLDYQTPKAFKTGV